MLSNALARHHQPDDMVQKDAATRPRTSVSRSGRVPGSWRSTGRHAP